MGSPKAKGKAAGRGRKAERPAIDLDRSIANARAAAKAAAKALASARTTARNERKKRARLVKKAAQLSSEDLERIAVLKRTGYWDASRGDVVEDPGAGDRSASSTTAAREDDRDARSERHETSPSGLDEEPGDE